MIEKISNRSEEIIEEIEKAKEVCMEMIKENTPVSKNFRKFKSELNEINEKFDSFEIDEKRCQEILAKCMELKENLNPIIENFKNDLLINQSYEFITKEFKINEIFGPLMI